jgi:hypothetical protein
VFQLSRRKVLTAVLPGVLLGTIFAGRAKAEPAADQPHMQAALDALRNAKRELDAADADKGGHRVKAIRLVEQAIAQVEKGISFDRRN